MQELRNVQDDRRHEETTSWKAASSTSGSAVRSDMLTGSSNPVFAPSPLSTLAPPNRLTTSELLPDKPGYSLHNGDERPTATHSSQIDQLVSAINNLHQSSNVMPHKPKCYTRRYPILEDPNKLSLNLNNHWSTTCHTIHTGWRKRTNYTTSKISWELKLLSIGIFWESIRKALWETSSSNSGKNLLKRFSEKSPNTSETNWLTTQQENFGRIPGDTEEVSETGSWRRGLWACRKFSVWKVTNPFTNWILNSGKSWCTSRWV